MVLFSESLTFGVEGNREEVKSKQHMRILYLLSSKCIFKNVLEL